jgi:hypothetical protein
MSIIALIEPYIAMQQDEIGASLAGDSPSIHILLLISFHR